MKVGNARYGAKSEKKYFKIKDGDNIFRLLPPVGDLAERGIWSKYYRVEWGYKDSRGKNRPFQDCREVNRQTKMVEVESAAHLYREKLNAGKEALFKSKKEGKPVSDEMLKKATEMCERYNVESKYYVNAISLQGEIGLLKIGYKAFISLKEEIDRMRSRGVDPLSVDNGRFFNFRRSGKGRDTIYQITEYLENGEAVVNGKNKIIQMEKVHVLDDSILSRLDAEAFHLDKLYPMLTAEQVEEIVRLGSVAVDKYLTKNNDSSSEEEIPENSEEVMKPLPAYTPAPKATMTVTPPKQEQAPVAPVAPPKQEPVKPQAPAAATAPTAELSDEDFLKQIGTLEY